MALMLIPTYYIAKQPRLISHIFFVTAISPIIEYCLSCHVIVCCVNFVSVYENGGSFAVPRVAQFVQDLK